MSLKYQKGHRHKRFVAKVDDELSHLENAICDFSAMNATANDSRAKWDAFRSQSHAATVNNELKPWMVRALRVMKVATIVLLSFASFQFE